MSDDCLKCPACGSDNVWSEEHLEEVAGPNRRDQRDVPVIVYECGDCLYTWRKRE